MQTNWIVERSALDSPLYANIFGASDDNDDVFIWPYVWMNREQAMTAAQADEFAAALYGGYLAAKVILSVGLVTTSLLAAWFLTVDLRLLLHVRFRVKPAKTEPAQEGKPPQSKP